MKVLWITNNIMPYPAIKLGLNPSNYGGWILAMIDDIAKKKDITLGIATIYNCKDIIEFEDNNIKYYLIPGKLDHKYHKKTEEFWKKLDAIFKADIVQLFGSEFYHGLAYLNAMPNKKCILNIQGLVSICGRDYLAGLTKKELRDSLTFRDIVRNDSIIKAQKKFLLRGEREKEIIKKVKYAIGRTFWDYYNVLSINPDIKYFKNNESLRKKFYEGEWNIEKIKRHTIFVSQALQPLKGLHMLIKTLKIVKRKYPDVNVFVSGPNIIDVSSFKSRIKLAGYGKYLRKLIKDNDLFDNIQFLGNLDEEGMCKELLSANVFVLPSKIENSSNSLGEAMLLGVPSIASYTGGTPDILENGKEGILYSYDDYEVLGQYIIKLFEDDELCKYFSKNAREKALLRHNLSNNLNDLYKIYDEVVKEDGK